MRSEGGVSSCFPTHDTMKLRHGWGTHFISVTKVPIGSTVVRCASPRGRSDWLWELFSI